MLQNRVDPSGHIIKVPERGAWTGNRGVLHDEHKNIVRPFKVKAWITCMLVFRGRHREVMTSNRWTELFFLDEATAFSAGHRPCFQCRYADHQRFKQYWLQGNPQYGFNMHTPIAAIDDILQHERIAKDKSKVTYEAPLRTLPDGVFVSHQGGSWLAKGGLLYPWSPAGYGTSLTLPDDVILQVLTPRSIVQTLQAGYLPQIDDSI